MTMMAYAFVLSLCLIATLTQAAPVDLRYCNPESAHAVEVRSVEVKEVPLHSGSMAMLTISATTGKPISYPGIPSSYPRANVSVELSRGTDIISSGTLDICYVTRCPVAEGDFQVTFTQRIPPEITGSATYTIKIDTIGEQLACVWFFYNIVHPPLAAEMHSSA